MLKLMVSVSLWMGCALAAEHPWAANRYAPAALREMDLASDTAWTLSVDGGAPRPIKVMAGGWNSDRQEPQIPSTDVKDYVVYERQITISAEAKDGKLLAWDIVPVGRETDVVVCGPAVVRGEAMGRGENATGEQSRAKPSTNLKNSR